MQNIINIISTLIIIAFWLTLYFLPAIIGRKKMVAKKIFYFNLFTAWSVIGWVASLLWALKPEQTNLSQSETNIDANNMALIEKLNVLFKQDIITEEEFALQKTRLLGNQSTPEPKSQRVTIAVASVFITAFFYMCYVYLVPIFYNEQTVIAGFLEDVKNQDMKGVLEQTDDYNDVLRQKNALPKITSYAVLNSQKIKSTGTHEVYTVSATVLNADSSNALVQNISFVVEKRGLTYCIKSSYNFLQSGTNQILFPATMDDAQRLSIAQQLNLTIQLVSSSCNINNNTAKGNLQVKNNYNLPVKNIPVQLEYVNKQQQTVKTQTVYVVGNNDELQPQETRTTNYTTPDCKDCSTVNVSLVKQQ